MRYVKRPDVSHVTIPGVGVVIDQILEGDYERFVPGKLNYYQEKPEAPAPSIPPVLDAVDPEPAAGDVVSVGGAQLASTAVTTISTPDMTWKRTELVAYAEALGVSTEGTKAEILERVTR